MAKRESKDFDVTLYHAHLQEFSKLVDAGRTHLSNCSGWDSTKDETFILENIGHGLVNVGQPEDAIPIFRRCVAFDKENTGCWVGLGEAYDRACRFDDAIEAYKKIIEIGGFTEINATRVETAKLAISNDDSASKQEEWRKLFHCPPKQSDVKSSPNR